MLYRNIPVRITGEIPDEYEAGCSEQMLAKIRFARISARLFYDFPGRQTGSYVSFWLGSNQRVIVMRCCVLNSIPSRP